MASARVQLDHARKKGERERVSLTCRPRESESAGWAASQREGEGEKNASGPVGITGPKSRAGREGKRRVLGLRARKRVKGFCLFIFYFLFFHSKVIFKSILKSL